MTFINPEYFWLLLFILAMMIRGDLFHRKFESMGYVVSFVFFVIALARPVVEQEPLDTKEKYYDAVVAVDLSYSMRATDKKPNRLVYAKESLDQLLKKTTQTRFGVLGFTTNAIILSPLTQDREILEYLFSSLDENLILTRGSAIMPALKLAREMSDAQVVSVVFFSDGTDQEEFTKEIAFAKNYNMYINIFMCATPMGGVIPLKDGEVLHDQNGHIVVSRQNQRIRSLSDATNGVYTTSIDEIVKALHHQREGEMEQITKVMQNEELFYYFIFIGFIFFFISATSLKRYMFVLLLLLGLELDADILEFARDDNYVAFTKGVEFYKQGEYNHALESFEKIHTSEKQIQAVVYFNIANSYVRMEQFKEAKEAYIKSLTLQYTKEADENLAYIRKVKKQKNVANKKKDKEIKEQRSASKTKQSKQGGGSNMKIDTSTNNGSSDSIKKTQGMIKLDMNRMKRALSSKQYELINARSINEEKPW